MATPSGMGKQKGSGLTGLAIMEMENVWLTCILMAPSVTFGVLVGARGVGREPEGARECRDRLGICGAVGDVLLLSMDIRGNPPLPGRGSVEFLRRWLKDMVNVGVRGWLTMV